PSPVDVVPVTLGRKTTLEAASEPLSALAFKVQFDDGGHQLTFVRVYTGTLREGDNVLNATKGQNEPIGKLVRMFANHREEIRQIEVGMIGAVVSPAARSESGPLHLRGRLSTGDALC